MDTAGTLRGQGLITSINNLKQEECLRPGAEILPAAARVWAMGVQVLTDTGVPVDMQPMERLFWSPVSRNIDMDHHFYKQTIKPLTRPRVALGFDFRAASPRIKREEAFELELFVLEDGRCNAIVFWHELHMGAHGTITTAPAAAASPGAVATRTGQALHFVEPCDVVAGQAMPIVCRDCMSEIAVYRVSRRGSLMTAGTFLIGGLAQPHAHPLRAPRPPDAAAAPWPLHPLSTSALAGRSLEPHRGRRAAQGHLLPSFIEGGAHTPRRLRRGHAVYSGRCGTA